MKCDTDPIACQPCRSKNLRCFTTDRVTGQARERGSSERAEYDLAYLQNQLSRYREKYGLLDPESRPPPSYPPPTTELALSSTQLPSSKYVGWPAPQYTEPIERGPVFGTQVNILDSTIDVADFDCDQMREADQDEPNVFNASRSSIVRSIFHFQSIARPEFPNRDEALQSADHFLVIMSQYVPIVHRSSFKAMVRVLSCLNQHADSPRSPDTTTIPTM